MRKLMFATNINGTEETGIVDIKSQRVFCLCTKEVADEILKALNPKRSIGSPPLTDDWFGGEGFHCSVWEHNKGKHWSRLDESGNQITISQSNHDGLFYYSPKMYLKTQDDVQKLFA